MTSQDYADGCSTLLRIDLNALRANYRALARRVAPAACSAVVKANAYGLGAEQVAAALYREGCRHYFVAQFQEALPLAALPDDVTIFILNGIAPGNEAACAEQGFIPVLNSQAQVRRWRACARAIGKALPAALQVDSGMSRLGLSATDAAVLAGDPTLSDDIDLRLIMTHLACADEPERSASAEQLAAFEAIRAHFPGIPASIANSGGVYLPAPFHLDIARPGIALNGSPPVAQASDIQPVVSLHARVVQIRAIDAGVGVGYGLDYVSPAPRRLAVIGIGYADGWPRILSGKGAAYYRGTRLPFVGRVSMDSIIIDISDLPTDALAEDDFVELIGAHQSVDDVARDAGTISYEILTQLGARHARIYVEDALGLGDDQ